MADNYRNRTLFRFQNLMDLASLILNELNLHCLRKF
jgi:hypothetical protein